MCDWGEDRHRERPVLGGGGAGEERGRPGWKWQADLAQDFWYGVDATRFRGRGGGVWVWAFRICVKWVLGRTTNISGVCCVSQTRQGQVTFFFFFIYWFFYLFIWMGEKNERIFFFFFFFPSRKRMAIRRGCGVFDEQAKNVLRIALPQPTSGYSRVHGQTGTAGLANEGDGSGAGHAGKGWNRLGTRPITRK